MRYCLDCRKVGAGVEKCKRLSSGACRIVNRGFRAKPPNDTITDDGDPIIEGASNMNEPLPGDAGPPLRSTKDVNVVNLAPAETQPLDAELTELLGDGEIVPEVALSVLQEWVMVSLAVIGKERIESLIKQHGGADGKVTSIPMERRHDFLQAVKSWTAEPESPAPRWSPEMPNEPVKMEGKPTTRAGDFLRNAARIVDGARNTTHGDKERSFVAIADLWNAYLRARRGGITYPVQAKDVAAMMVLLKFARAEWGEFVPDHAIDAAGYSAIFGELAEAQQKGDLEDDF